MAVFEKLVIVKEFINEEIQRLQNMLPITDQALSELQDKSFDSNGILSAIDVLASSCVAVENANIAFVKELNSVLSLLKPTIQWHSNKKEMLEMFYLDGNSPWCVWLTYNPSMEIDGLYKILEQKHSAGLLKKVINPKVGDFICCYDKKILFRAVIIEVSNTRIKVINIDRYNTKIIKLDACYEITQDMCGVHAYSIQCCLTKDRRFEKKWNEDLGRLFQNTLKECRLTVRIVEELQSLPPLFLVEIYAFNEALELETNISHWITSRLLPELNNLTDDNDQVLDLFSDEALDPYLDVPNVSRTVPETSSLDNSKSNMVTQSVCNLPRTIPETSSLDNNKSNLITQYVSSLSRTIETSSLDNNKNNVVMQSVCNSVQKVSLEENKEKPRNRLAHLIKGGNDLAIIPNKSLPAKPEEYKKSCNSSILPENMSSNIDFKNNYPSNGIAPYLPENREDPIKGQHDGSETNDLCNRSLFNGYDNDGVVYEDSVFPSNYIPTDNNRICAFYAKKGFCWKPGCQKQHTKTERDRWTGDTAEIFKDTINSLGLPTIGSTVTLTVTYIVLSTSFYVTLPDYFSDTGDGCETLSSLIESLNSFETKKELKLLSTPAGLGQHLIAYCKEKSLWLRAVVVDIYEHDILQVFFVDCGITAELSVECCREIEPQYMHLPKQAVYCTLAKVFAESGTEAEGKSYLESLILDKEIEAKIIDSDSMNNSLEIVAYAGGVNINQLMTEKGYLLPFFRH